MVILHNTTLRLAASFFSCFSPDSKIKERLCSPVEDSTAPGCNVSSDVVIVIQDGVGVMRGAETGESRGRSVDIVEVKQNSLSLPAPSSFLMYKPASCNSMQWGKKKSRLSCSAPSSPIRYREPPLVIYYGAHVFILISFALGAPEMLPTAGPPNVPAAASTAVESYFSYLFAFSLVYTRPYCCWCTSPR